MKKWIVLFIASVLLLFLFGSCRSTKTEVVTEYVPVAIDLTDVVEPVFKLRPDNSKLEINTSNILTVLDVTKNSLQYQKAWESWQLYAEALEKVILNIEDVYGQE